MFTSNAMAKNKISKNYPEISSPINQNTGNWQKKIQNTRQAGKDGKQNAIK